MVVIMSIVILKIPSSLQFKQLQHNGSCETLTSVHEKLIEHAGTLFSEKINTGNS